jgi:2-keto-4-pentenoate hydratase/2-oxohepta-3-ene-1,7-dioic acid hydratase in catechol pathway
MSKPRLGIVIKNTIIDAAEAYRLIYETKPPNWLQDLKTFLEGGAPAQDILQKLIYEVEKSIRGDTDINIRPIGVDEVIYYPPILRPSKIICMALNYRSHAEELGRKIPSKPYAFIKLGDTIIGHKWPIIAPKSSKKVDYEVELAVVIGKRGKYISSSKAYEYVAGYTIFNDISFRDWQRPDTGESVFGPNWLHGKNMDSSAPIGPYLVTRDEIPNPYPLRLTLRVNGEVRQDNTTNDMIFKIPEIIEFVSQGITLKPGDIIATGTPGGVGLASGRFLKHGDVVEAEIERIGRLINTVISE